MYRTYGDAHSVIDASGAMSQLPFKATMTRGYASDLRNQGQWYLNEADRIENGTSTTWSSSRGRFGSEVAASSEVTGSRSESGSRASDTHNVGGNVLIEGSSGKSTREVTNDDLILRQGNNRSSGNFDQRAFGTSATLSANGSSGTPGARRGHRARARRRVQRLRVSLGFSAIQCRSIWPSTHLGRDASRTALEDLTLR